MALESVQRVTGTAAGSVTFAKPVMTQRNALDAKAKALFTIRIWATATNTDKARRSLYHNVLLCSLNCFWHE
ncbi:MAG: hypothetical protein C0417_11070 [Chlorobiaceae bacterium]|nr:hypothetical protein [Chlorobiaceae bacterium]